MDRKSILIFGVGPLQESIIKRCKMKGLYTVGIDPSKEASCKDQVDAFEIVGGQDFDKTLEVAERYQVKGIITAATDKPLVMMARIAEKLKLPFFSTNTAEWSTDKLLMKQRFQETGISCANGFVLTSIDELSNLNIEFPVIVKPRDNSGSRGVIYCENLKCAETAAKEAMHYTKKGNVLIEEYIYGKEYSIECIHYEGKTHVIQFTEKLTTQAPYNVELGHIEPAELTKEIKQEIYNLVCKLAKSMNFENCASHTEIKINSKGIFVIESSPRLGGDFITSHLVPLSTYVNIEDQLINIAIGEEVECMPDNNASLISFFNFPVGNRVMCSISFAELFYRFPNLVEYKFELNIGDRIGLITNSLNRYGYFILAGKERKIIMKQRDKLLLFIENQIFGSSN